MQYLLLLSILLCSAFVPEWAIAQEREQSSIASNWKGTDWKGWDIIRKLWYVWGFRAGENAAAGAIREELGVKFNSLAGKRIQRWLGVAASVEQIARGIDTVYQDYRNDNLPLWEVAAYVADSIGGFQSESDLDTMRRFYNQPKPSDE